MTSVPPLLALAAGKRVRARRAPKVTGSELALHYATVDLLRKVGRSDWRWTHFPSGEARDPRVGAKLRAMGLSKGWPDIQLVSPRGVYHGLELKTATGELSEDQRAFQLWAARYGVHYSVARSLAEVLTIFGHWGCILPVR